MDYFNDFLDFFLAFIIMILIPFVWMEMETELILQQEVEEVVEEFVNDACTSGIITRERYMTMMDSLSDFGVLYSVDMENTHTVYVRTQDGEVDTFADETGSGQILDIISRDGLYLMCSNDYLYVTISNQGDSIARKLTSLILHERPSGWAGYGMTVSITDYDRYRKALGGI